MKKENVKNILITSIILLIALSIGLCVGVRYYNFRNEEVYFDFTVGESTVDGHKEYRQIQTLKDYSPTISEFGGSTKIYITAGEEAQKKFNLNGNYKGCASILILGGTHANEPSGQLTATTILENLTVSGNTVVFIITETNKSGFSYTFPQEGAEDHYSLTTRDGSIRTFKYGGRATNPIDQWPNPDIYTVIRTVDGEDIESKLSSTDSRNLNRAYGVSNPVTYTEKVAKGIENLIKVNDIKISIDLHEASPEYQTINAIVYRNTDNVNPDNTNSVTQKIASATSSSMLSDNSVEIGQAFAPTSLRGLSHIELGTVTDTFMFLIETSNASQGKLRGAFTEELITYQGSDYSHNDYDGDLFYERFNDTFVLYANAVTVSERVARHTMTILEIVYQYNKYLTDGTISKSINEERANECVNSGTYDLHLRLYDKNSTGKNSVKDFYEIDNYYDIDGLAGSPEALQAYELIYAYGVGYFLSSEK